MERIAPNRWIWLATAVVLSTALACGNGSNSISSDEAWPTQAWRVEAPEQHGMDSATLDGARAYAFQPGKNTQGVVVTRHGVIVGEWYEEGRS